MLPHIQSLLARKLLINSVLANYPKKEEKKWKLPRESHLKSHQDTVDPRNESL